MIRGRPAESARVRVSGFECWRAVRFLATRSLDFRLASESIAPMPSESPAPPGQGLSLHLFPRDRVGRVGVVVVGSPLQLLALRFRQRQFFRVGGSTIPHLWVSSGWVFRRNSGYSAAP